MRHTEALTRQFTVRMTSEELSNLEQLRARLQKRAQPGTTITQRSTILIAMERLAAHLDKLEKDAARR